MFTSNPQILCVYAGIFLFVYAFLGIEISIHEIRLPRLQRTQRKKLATFGILLLIIGLIPLPKTTEEETFNEPLLFGNRVDICLIKGFGCGSEAASKWCRSEKGLKFATSFEVDQVGKKGIPTRVIGDNSLCEDNYCTAFSSITCLK